ncbi:hypothetical protein FDP41_008985 [Naegleria fowleri]|uniref:Uncharacterized protein n=1 Tax=Naegleria fowleri TaxID=5763 RepID=A0A6A5BDG1_NAEFO|nr:uncharacterized protein FDP41_008985 [Naegleria fowleri]KAF0972736.1 hypothetical protein FDP41_008985 [Naegleria fowleri]CAG4710337.1 unnamed protein product [Naegleria fowleri]
MVKFEDISSSPTTPTTQEGTTTTTTTPKATSSSSSQSSHSFHSFSRLNHQQQPQGLKFRSSPFFLSLLLVGGLVIHGFISFHPNLHSIQFLSSFFKLFVGYQDWLRIGFYGALLVHVIEAVVCYRQIHSFFKTHHVKRDESVLWKYIIQTLIVGFPSFWVLHEEMSKFVKSHSN